MTRWQGQKAVLELKILHKNLKQTIREGVKQTWKYMDRCGTDVGHLVVFDRREDVSWETKLFRRNEEYEEQPITVWGM